MNTIKVEIKTVYGNEMIYPLCEDAKLFAKLAGTKTLTREALRTIKTLGYELEIAAKTLNL